MSCSPSAGIGAQERALRQLNIPYKVKHTCDCDANAVLSYAAMRWDLEQEMKTFKFPSQDKMIEELQAKNLGYDFQKGKHGITKRTPINKLKQYYIADKLSSNLGDISKVDKLPYADIVTYSFPCFVPGTMVLTDNGYKKIEDIQEGDMVLTHTNQYQKVIKPMKNYCDSYVYKINAMCSDPIYTTEEHPFYVRKRHRVSNPSERYSNGRLKRIRKFDEPEWVKAKDLTKDYYIGVAINQKSEIPKWDGMIFHWSDNRGDRYSNKLGQYMDKEDFWWIIGRYLGDGWLVDGYGTKPSTGIKICCAKQETTEITTVLDRIQINYVITQERTVNKIQISMRELYEFCLQFGRGAANKHLTSTILNLPVNLLKAFLDGYISADGNLVKKQNLYRATSVSRELIYGLGQCIAKVYKTPFSVYKTIRPKTCVIEGRTVNQKDSYNITFKTDKRKQDHAFYEDGYIWCPINDISIEEYNGYVYNMEVENDNSYVVQNIIVHNCTDLSVAGKGEGMVNKCDVCGNSWSIDFSNAEESLVCPNCGAKVYSSTRSGLLGQVQRLLNIAKENNTLPKYLLLENVKNLIGKKFKPQFDAWVNWLDSIGYNTYYKVLNAKHFGIPQNRERIFAISIRKDIDTNGFIFPEPIPLTTRLKDILEHNVDEKYYLPDDRIEKILNSSFMQEKKRIQTTDVCDTLLARDWKDPKCVPVEEDVNPIRIGNIYDEKFGTGYAGNVWDKEGISPTLQTAQGGNRQPLVIDEIKVIGNYMPSNHDASRVVDVDGIAPTVKENHGTVTAIAEPFIVASRGRNPENPSDRTTGAPTEQRLEPNFSGCTNTITSVQKDNYVCEPHIAQCIGGIGEKKSNGGSQYYQQDRVYYGDVALAHPANIPGGSYMYLVDEPIIYDDYNSRIPQDQDAITTLTTNCGASAERNGVKIIEPVIVEDFYQSREPRVYAEVAPTLRSERTGLKVADKVEYPCTTRGKQVASTIRASIYKQGARNLEENVTNGLGYEGIIEEEQPKIKWRIRKLIEKECWRLMNFTDADHDRAAKYTSASARYKQAGNSIVVACLIAIFSSLFLEDGYKSDVWTKYSLNYWD